MKREELALTAADPEPRTVRPEPAFWRLLTDYERVTVDESIALRGGDFDSLQIIHGTKATLIAGLQSLARHCRFEGQRGLLQARVDKLIHLERMNAVVVHQFLQKKAEERRVLELARFRLRGLSSTYHSVTDPVRGPGGFFARG